MVSWFCPRDTLTRLISTPTMGVLAISLSLTRRRSTGNSSSDVSDKEGSVSLGSDFVKKVSRNISLIVSDIRVSPARGGERMKIGI